MKKKSKIVIARIMAILMMLSILPADYLGAASVVMAEELGESVASNDTLDNDSGDLDNDGYLNTEVPEGPESIGGIQEDGTDSTDDPDGETKDDGDAPNEETPDGGDNSDGLTDDTEDTDELSDPDDATDADVSYEVESLGNITIKESGGYEEGAYAEWTPYNDADGYVAYVSKNSSTFTEDDRIDNELIRKYEDHWRVDTVGLAAGTYYIKVSAVTVGEADGSGKKVLTEIATATTTALTVTNYDRSGFAFSPQSTYKTASGAYNEDGTLKTGAQVVYVTADTAKTCTATVKNTVVTGIQAILDAKQKADTTNDILDIRIIGCINIKDLDGISSSAQGLQVKGNKARTNMNLTIEGIGEDAGVWGFGFLIRNCANVEFRNFGIMRCMDDGVSIDTDNCNLWMHDLDIFYGKQGSGDKAKGDGALDIKKSEYCTVSYVHFWDTGKSCLLDAQEASSGGSNYITYHHNWFDHSDSRHPRVRNAKSVHVYNNYYDGNAKYGVGSTTGSSTFVEANYFRNCANPMLIAEQGTDAKGEGTFSGESGGMIKAFGNYIEGAKSYIPYSSSNTTEFDAYEVDDKTKQVPADVKTKKGSSYSNFDTDSTMYSYTADTAEVAKEKVVQNAGRLGQGDLQWTFDASEDSNYSIIQGLQDAIGNYETSIKSIGGIDGVVVGSLGGSSGSSGGGNSGGSGGDNPGGSEGDNSGGSTARPGISGAGLYVHNFTGADGNYTDSNDFFTINGNKQSKPSSFEYTDVTGEVLTLKQAMKMESATEITFTSESSGTLILVFPSNTTAKTKVDGEKYTPDGGIIEVSIESSGTHTVTKGDSADLYYIAFLSDGYDPNAVSEPEFDKPQGDVPLGTSITLTCKTADAEIYYTMNGTDPSAESTHYEKGTSIPLTGSEGDTITVKAIAIKDDNESNIVTRRYTLVDLDKYVAEPEASESDGELAKGTQVALTSATSGASIYYTSSTDGTEPSEPSATNGALYEGPITINQSIIIRAIAIKGSNKSSISRFKYTVSDGNSGGSGTYKKYEFNPQKAGVVLDETDSSDSSKKLHTLPEADTKYGTDGYFTIGNKDNKAKFASTTTKAPAGNKSELTDYTVRYQFGGTAASAADPKAIRFKTEAEALVTVCAYLVNNTKRNLYLDSDSNYCEPSKEEIKEYTFDVEKGSHGIYAKDGDIAILYVIVEENPTADPGGDEKTTYTVTLDYAGATGGIEQTSYTVEDGKTLKLPTPTREGYTFRYWVDENNEHYNGGDTIAPKSDMSLKAVWRTEGEADSWTVELEDDEFTYTGNAIKPAVTVYGYDGEVLVEGVDYTVKYSNNTNASVKADGSLINPKKVPTVTISGKGIISGKDPVEFTILPKNIAAADVAVADIIIETGKKVTAPVICYNGVKLSTKDYKYKNEADKSKTTFADGDTLDIIGQGNFEGELSVPIKVVAKGQLKNTVKKFKVNIDKNKVKNLVYTGENLRDDIIGCISVEPKTDDYVVTLPDEVIDAGTVKFMVVGLGDYSGCSVSKSVKIQPKTIADKDISINSDTEAKYVSTGATLSNLTVTLNGQTAPLENGKDYKLSYSGNKKADSTAKYTITFKGNLKGKVTKTFKVGKAVLENGIEGINVEVPDKVLKDNASCKSTTYVTIDDVLVKSSEYEVTYSVGDENGTYSANPKVAFGGADSKTVYVKIKAKGKNYTTGTGNEVTGEYTVWNKAKATADNDLSKAKVTFYSDDAGKNKATKFEYDGSAIEPGSVTVTIGKGTKNYAEQCDFIYVNNVNKGKATVIIKPKSDSGLIGGKTATFSIVARNLNNNPFDIVSNAANSILNLFK